MIVAAPTWAANPKQDTFLHDYAAVDEVLYGGAAGGGKSDALLMFSLFRRQEWPLSKGLLLRRTYPELMMQGGLIPRSHDLFTGLGQWNGEHKTWTFPNRSVIQFAHLVHEDSWRLYYGSAWEDVGFDELTLFTPTQYLMVGMARARTAIPGCRPKTRATTNPGNEGHVFVRDRFIESLPPLKVGWFTVRNGKDARLALSEVEHEPLAKSRAFVPARLEDNPYLYDSGFYEANLAALPDDDYKALRWGDWYAWSGQVFKRWRQDRHVIEPRKIGPKALRFCGLDWGYASPFVCLWIAYAGRLPSDPEAVTDPKTKLVLPARCDGLHGYVYRELTLTQKLDEEHASAVVAAMAPEEVGLIQCWNADPTSFFQKREHTGPTAAQIWWNLTKGRVELLPSNNERIPGKRAVDHALADCACGVPRLRVFSTCTDLIRTIPSLGYDSLHPEDVQKSDLDHWYDALRYALMGRQPTSAPFERNQEQRGLIGLEGRWS